MAPLIAAALVIAALLVIVLCLIIRCRRRRGRLLVTKLYYCVFYIVGRLDGQYITDAEAL